MRNSAPVSSPALADEYFVKVIELIFKVRRVTGQPPLENQELHLTAMAWTEIIQPLIPLNRLDECYMRAIRTRTTTYPFSVSELCQVWQQIRETSANPLFDEEARRRLIPTLEVVMASLKRESDAVRSGSRDIHSLLLEGPFWWEVATLANLQAMLRDGKGDAEIERQASIAYHEVLTRTVKKYEALAAKNS